MTDFIMKNKAINIGPKFPHVASEFQEKIDNLIKIRYIDSLVDRLKVEFEKHRTICEMTSDHLNKQLLKIFYISIQAKIARD
jgi:hypothetical protein